MSKSEPRSTFSAKSLPVVQCAIELLQADHPQTLRQLFYQTVSAGMLPNLQQAYKKLGRLVGRLREDGAIPMAWIVDSIRTTLKPSSWSGLGDFGDTVRRAYRLDYWDRLPECVEIIVEKDSLAGALQAVTEKYDVALRVCRGYASISFAGEIAAEWRRIKKPIYVYYIGDFDPSGFDIERDIRAKLERYSGRFIVGCDLLPMDHEYVSWRRLAVVDADWTDHNLIALPGKQGDMRYKAFVEEHGPRCAEVEGLPAKELRRRVEEAILSHIDEDEWARLEAVEKAERETMDAVISQWRVGA